MAVTKCVGAVLAAGLLAACSSPNDGPALKASLMFDSESSPNARPNVAYIVALAHLCTTGSPLSIERIGAQHPTGGLRVTEWGIRRRYAGDSYGEYAVPLSGAVGQTSGFGQHPVTTRCGSAAADYDELTLGVTIAASRATMTGVWITYRSAGQSRKALVKYEAAYCAAAGPCAGLTKSERG